MADIFYDFDYLAELPGTPQEQGWLKERLETLSVLERCLLTAAITQQPTTTAGKAVECLHSLADYTACFPAGNHEQLGRYVLQGIQGFPPEALPYVYLDELGRQYEEKHPGLFVGNCYVICPDAITERPDHIPLLEDLDWSVKLKLASPAVPEGVWLRLPDFSVSFLDSSIEIELARDALKVQCLDDCELLETRCVLPEAGAIQNQYDSIEWLVRDGNALGCILAERGQGEPQWMEKFAAALEYEDCHTLRFALDVSQNLGCYEYIPCGELADFAKKHMLAEKVPEDLINSGCIDLDSLAEELLEASGYMLTAGKTGYVTRNSREFVCEYSEPQEPGITMI